MDQQYSLDNLRDIVLPEPPPLWPPPVEAWWFMAIIGLSVVIIFYQWRRARRLNAYRRHGLAMLDKSDTVQEISVILKRVALAAFPREQVASLYGEDWFIFLQQTCPRRDFSPLQQAIPETPASHEIRRLAAAWIRHHRIPLHKGSS